jgi:hypothetical protein
VRVILLAMKDATSSPRIEVDVSASSGGSLLGEALRPTSHTTTTLREDAKDRALRG